jgi:hypothetical protein
MGEWRFGGDQAFQFRVAILGQIGANAKDIALCASS